ncbi:MAG TPA: methyltransferase domain-containing protein [Patescibacteria group bacterium]|nr:methyltransferase domain-containing protein [Patescibacteria group bacterium]
MTVVKTITPPTHIRLFLHLVGMIFLILNKVRHALRGYGRPRPFSADDIEQAISYDFSVVASWQKHLTEYTAGKTTVKDHTVLELGPGADLGVGLMLLAQGAKKYYALDANYLIGATPPSFYDALYEKIKTQFPTASLSILPEQLSLTMRGSPDRLNYTVDKYFNLEVVPAQEIDLVCSQAAFEHFSDVKKTIEQLSAIVKPGTILVAEIDLQTHSRWIRDHDPLNIYRYSNWFYRLCQFSGSPNRVRPYEYAAWLEQNGWGHIEVKPLVALANEYTKKITPRLAGRFQDSKNQMEVLSCMLLATKK